MCEEEEEEGGLEMPRYYCDYCDAYLTHDSASVRKQHNIGFKHKANVRAYYALLKRTADEEATGTMETTGEMDADRGGRQMMMTTTTTTSSMTMNAGGGGGGSAQGPGQVWMRESVTRRQKETL